MDPVPTEDINVIEAETCVDIRGQDAELRHRPNDIGLLDYANAIYRPCRISLDDIDFEAALPQCNCGSQTANTAADNQNPCFSQDATPA